MAYEKPELSTHGSVASLTNGKPGSDVDGNSGLQGNASMSDTTGGGANAGMNPAGMANAMP
jgi:hypothetical protein